MSLTGFGGARGPQGEGDGDAASESEGSIGIRAASRRAETAQTVTGRERPATSPERRSDRGRFARNRAVAEKGLTNGSRGSSAACRLDVKPAAHRCVAGSASAAHWVETARPPVKNTR